jgi:hypothetical protein
MPADAYMAQRSKLESQGLSPDEAQTMLKLVDKMKSSYETRKENATIARRSFAEWLKDTMPAVGRALGMAASAISKVIGSLAELIAVLS